MIFSSTCKFDLNLSWERMRVLSKGRYGLAVRVQGRYFPTLELFSLWQALFQCKTFFMLLPSAIYRQSLIFSSITKKHLFYGRARQSLIFSPKTKKHLLANFYANMKGRPKFDSWTLIAELNLLTNKPTGPLCLTPMKNCDSRALWILAQEVCGSNATMYRQSSVKTTIKNFKVKLPFVFT